MKDKHGREYVRLSDLAPGDHITVDDGMGCIEPWSRHVVQSDEGRLFIHCDHGKHMLEGQVHDEEHDDHLIGIYKGELERSVA